MAWQKRSRKGERVVRRKQRDGTIKEYRYPAYISRPHAAGDTLEGLIEAYRRSPEWVALSDQTRAGRTGYLKPLYKIGHLSIVAVKRRDIIAIHDAMKVGRGNGAAGGFLAAAKALFRWAVDKDRLEHSPVNNIKATPGGHLRAWTRAEADAAERGLSEHLRRAIVLARHTGQRRGDLCGMTWAAYDGGALRIVQQKKKPGEKPVALVIPATPALKAELDRWKQDAKAVTILTNAAGRPWKPASLSHVLPIALGKIGLSTDLNIHGLRKLAATELADAGCSPHEIAAITGHRTLAMVQLYTAGADQERLASAAVVRLQSSYNLQTGRKSARKIR